MPAWGRPSRWGAGALLLAPLAACKPDLATRDHERAASAIPIATAAPGAEVPVVPGLSSAAVPPAVDPSAPPREALARCPPEPPLAPGSVHLPLALVLLAGDRRPVGGSATIGKPTRGELWAGVELEASDSIALAGGYHWATARSVLSIERAAREVARCHPGSPPLIVGDLSRERGGWLRPHRSHQAGIDADLGYFYTTPATWYLRATAANLDRPRTWTLVRALIEGGNVETIFIDTSVQRLLQEHVATLPPTEQPPDGVFRTPTRRDAIIQHAWGHATHLHVRFRDPDAERLGARIDRARGSTRPKRR